MKKCCLLIIICSCINTVFAEVQISYKGPYYFRAYHEDFSYMFGVGPLFKEKLNRELYITSKIQQLYMNSDQYSYLLPKAMSAELQLSYKKTGNGKWDLFVEFIYSKRRVYRPLMAGS